MALYRRKLVLSRIHYQVFFCAFEGEPVLFRAMAGNLPELAIEVRQVFVTAFVTYPQNIPLLCHQQAGGMGNAYFVNKLGEGLLHTPFEIAAKRSFIEMHQLRGFLTVQFFFEGPDHVLHNGFKSFRVAVGELHERL